MPLPDLPCTSNCNRSTSALPFWSPDHTCDQTCQNATVLRGTARRWPHGPGSHLARVRSPEREWVARPVHSASIVDAVLMGLLVVRLPAPGSSLPTAQVAIMGLLAVSLFRRPTRSLRPVGWFPVLGAGLLGFAIVASSINGVSFERRAANIAVLFTMAGFLASGRIDARSALKGLLAALAVNALLFYTGVTPDHYEGRLTGLLEDKNSAGLMYAVGPLLASMLARRRVQRAAVIAAGAVALMLTDSRTSMAAYAVAVVWLLLSGRLGQVLKLAFGTLLFMLFRWADANLAEVGHYAAERSGSDALRARIDAASTLKAAGSPWYGRGLGEAVVNLDGASWFFHNSYEALRVEGGVVFLVGILLIHALSGLGLARRRARTSTYADRTVASATIVVLLCATRLGEVFLAPIGLLVVGIGLAMVTGPLHQDERAPVEEAGCDGDPPPSA